MGGAQKPITPLVFARLRSGMVTGSEQHYTTTTGRQISLSPFQTWCSMDTICEDIQAATGQPVERHKVKYAAKKLEKAGHILGTELAFPETRGRYGKVYQLNPDSTRKVPNMVDTIVQYRLHYYGDCSAFRLGVAAGINPATGQFSIGTPNMAEGFRNRVAARGVDHALFTSIGRWRKHKEVRDPRAPVFVPWLVFDIDRHDDIPGAYEAAQNILLDLEEWGIDLERTFVSFSGSKGFHIAISMDHFGSPIFRDSEAARLILSDVTKRITETRVDHHTLSPLNLVRLTGSQNEKSGWYKRTWCATRFRQMPLHAALADLSSPLPFRYPDPTAGAVEDDLRALFDDTAEQRATVLTSQRANRRHGSKAIGPTITSILSGVSEGEEYADGRAGRDWAAYTLACFLLESEQQCADVAAHLAIDARTPQEIMTYWNENLCRPSLRARHIEQKLNSAKKTVLK